MLEQAVAEIRNDAVDPAVVEAAAARVWAHLAGQASTPAGATEHIRGCADFQALIPEYRAGKLAPARELLQRSPASVRRLPARIRRPRDGHAIAASDGSSPHADGSMGGRCRRRRCRRRHLYLGRNGWPHRRRTCHRTDRQRLALRNYGRRNPSPGCRPTLAGRRGHPYRQGFQRHAAIARWFRDRVARALGLQHFAELPAILPFAWDRAALLCRPRNAVRATCMSTLPIAVWLSREPCSESVPASKDRAFP